MYELSQAISDHMEFEQLSDGGWRATFRGALSASAEAKTPDAASWEVRKELEKLVAEWIVKAPASTPEVAPPPGRQGSNSSSVPSVRKRKLRIIKPH